jgi:hypothetical protein
MEITELHPGVVVMISHAKHTKGFIGMVCTVRKVGPAGTERWGDVYLEPHTVRPDTGNMKHFWWDSDALGPIPMLLPASHDPHDVEAWLNT